MKIFNFCFMLCIILNSCDIFHTSKDEYTIEIPKEIDGCAFDYTKKWEDYRSDMKPYNVLDMTNKSVSEISKLYGEPIFNKTDTICFGKIRSSSIDTTYFYHNEPDIAYMFRGTPKIPLYQMW